MLKEKIVAAMRHRAFVNLEDLSIRVPDMVGHHDWHIEDKNIVMWRGLTKPAIYYLNQLINDGVITVRFGRHALKRYNRKPSLPVCYYKERRCTNKHWLPVVLTWSGC